MKWPLFESIAATAATLPPALFSAAAVKRITSIAHVARGSADAFGFECRLARGVERVDLGVRVLHVDRHVRRWFGRVADARGAFRCPVSWAYLEYDAEPEGRSTKPSLFLGIEGGTRDFRAVKRSFRAIAPRGLRRAAEATLARCLDRLPPDGRLLVIGAMLGRSPASGRVSLSVPKRAIGGYLRELGWPHWTPSVERVVARVLPARSPLIVDFDMGAVVGPTVGVHLPVADGSSGARVLDVLVELGLCSAGKRHALRLWSRPIAVRPWARSWPCRFDRYVDHVKLACEGGEVRAAKVYLGIAPGFSLVIPRGLRGSRGSAADPTTKAPARHYGSQRRASGR